MSAIAMAMMTMTTAAVVVSVVITYILRYFAIELNALQSLIVVGRVGLVFRIAFSFKLYSICYDLSFRVFVLSSLFVFLMFQSHSIRHSSCLGI